MTADVVVLASAVSGVPMATLLDRRVAPTLAGLAGVASATAIVILLRLA